jgi:drug/metabolite transporter (DMT)-like permease
MKKYSILAVILSASLWGVDGVLLTPSLYNLNVPIVVFIESSLVALLLTPYYFKYIPDIKKFSVKDLLSILLVALFGGTLGTLAITKALFYVNYVNLSIVILIQKLQPVFALVFAATILKEKPQKEFYIWATIAIIGAYIMTFGFNKPIVTSDNKTVYAVLFSLLAAVSFGLSTVLSKRALRNIKYDFATYLRFLFSSIIMLFIVGFSNSFANLSQITLTNGIVFILIAFTTGGTAIYLYYYGLRNISASVATICELSFPLTAILLEYFVRGNVLNVVQWIGVLTLLLAIIKVSSLNR